MRYRQHIAGFTLLELMISVALGLILISGAFTLFVSAMKNSEATMMAQEKQNEVMNAMQWLVNDITNADAFGCARTSVACLNLQGIHGDVSQLIIAYQAGPHLALLRLSEDGLHVSIEPEHQFYQNEVLLFSSPDEANRVVVKAEKQSRLTLSQPLTFKHIKAVTVGPYASHHYVYDAKHNTLNVNIDKGENATLLDDVEALVFHYDVKTPTGIMEKQPETEAEWRNVCGVNITLTCAGQTWARYVPVLSHCL